MKKKLLLITKKCSEAKKIDENSRKCEKKKYDEKIYKIQENEKNEMMNEIK